MEMQQNNQVPPPIGSPAPMGVSAQVPASSSASNEELIEAIIDEKWNDLLKDITKIIEWKNSTKIQISKMEQSFTDLKGEFDKLHQAVVGKVGDYDKHILDIGAEIQSMEKVFAKVLPVFTENVSELGRITDDLRVKKK